MHVSPQAIGPRPLVVPTPQPRPLRRAMASTARTAGHALGAFADGFFPVALVAYVVGVGLTVAAQRLDLGVLDFLLPAAIAAVVIGVLAGLARLALAVLRRLAGGLRRRVETRTERGRIRALAAAPDRALRWVHGGLVGTAGAVVVLVLLPGDGPIAAFKPSLLLVPAMLLPSVAAGLVGVARHARRRPGRAPRAVTGASVALAVVLVAGGAAWAVWPGDASGLATATAAFAGSPVRLDVPDPASPGPYQVIATSYGSGTDRHRAAYGPEVAVRTPTVKAPISLDRYPGIAGDVYRAFWGFDFEELPLNALVWYPVGGSGPFPLVLIVHGNHTMGEFSEPGYAYLAERLASHGMVVASVDENFLNGGIAGDMGGKEMPTRAWLLLLHLDQWRQWNGDPASRFRGLVDLERIALIGHSRGGEAASVAAMFSRLPFPPVTGLDPWPTGLEVRAVVSIAPSDGQFGNGTTKLTGVDFLTISGGEDSDASGWSGIRQYARTTPDDAGFKAAVWAYRANHGQFNTVWGASDHGPYATWLVNRQALMPAADQQQIARVYVGGFLAMSLQDRDEYRALFTAPGAGADWLPDQTVLVRSSAGGFEPLLDGSRPSRRLTDGVTESERELRRVTLDLPLRGLQDTQQNRVELLRWEAGAGRAEYRLDVSPAIANGLTDAHALRFALADGRAPDAEGTIDPLVTLATADGAAVSHRLSEWADLAPPLPAAMYKSVGLASALGIDPGVRTPVERVLQTWSLPLAAFGFGPSGGDAATIVSVSFSFDRATAGAVYLDEVGFAAP